MQFLKSLLRGLASFGLKFGLFSLAIVTAIVMVFGTSTKLKQALHNSKIYDNLIENIIKADNQSGNRSDTNVSLADPQIKQAAQTAFSPAFIQSSTEQVIDSVYKWLQGSTAKPDFKIDLSGPKLRFATAAADNAAARARQLPPCTPQQTLQLARSNPDPFTIPCMPAGVDINQVRNQIITDLANNEAIAKTPVITADTLPKDMHGKTIFDTLSSAPLVFHWMMLSPWILGVLALISGIVLITLYDEKRRGLRAVAIITLGSGIFLLVSTWIITFAFNQINKPGGPLGKAFKNALQNNFIAFLRSINNTFNGKLLVFGAIYTGFGIAILLILHFTKPTVITTPGAELSLDGLPEKTLEPPDGTTDISKTDPIEPKQP